MATTDARPGFKLPWSADRNESDTTEPNETTETSAAGVSEGEPPVDAAAEPTVAEPAAEPTVPAVDAAAASDPWRLDTKVVEEPPRRKPNKLMAELTKAMQVAAETARDESLSRLQTDAKAFIEGIHARSGTEADELRQRADADIAGIREWSKAEIARIREETDERVTARKTTLESEIEAHAGRIEGRIERVQAHVAWFETEMAAFFEQLLAEDDPTHLAAMAENLPEPPSFEDGDFDLLPDPPTPVAQAVAEVEPASDAAVERAAEAVDDPEVAFAAIQAAAEAAEGAEAADVAVEPAVEAETNPEPDDPRLAAITLSPEVAAEAEAEAEVDPAADGDEIATFSDDALAARLAGLVPPEGEAPHPELRTTRVVVTGLISVASIAGFKRHLGRLEGVASVGVSSGPDGEFVFAVAHEPQVSLRDLVPGLPGFAATVTDATEDTVSVAARDPETES